VPTFDLPYSAARLHGQEATHSKLLESFQRFRSKLFRQSVQEVTTAVFEAVCERAFGSTLAALTPTLLITSSSISSLISGLLSTSFLPVPQCFSASPPHSSSLSACFPQRRFAFPQSLLPSCFFPPCTLLTFTPLSLFPSSFYLPCPGLCSFRSVIWCVCPSVLCVLVGNELFDIP
jgi:hypothetical protein